MKQKTTYVLFILFLIFYLKSYSQSSFVCSGGSNSQLSHSLGQTFVKYQKTNEGVQQPSEFYLKLNETTIEDLIIYPNPFVEKITIVCDQNYLGSFYTLYNLEGKLLLQGEILKNQTELNLFTIANENYILNLVKNNITKTIKIVKK